MRNSTASLAEGFMKTISIQEPNKDQRTPSWWLPIIAWISFSVILLSSDDLFQINLHLGFAMILTIGTFFGNKRAKNPSNDCKRSLVFRDNSLVCHDGNVTVWYIPNSMISHIKIHQYNSGKFKVDLIHIHTFDGDSYSLPNKVSKECFEEIQQEINKLQK